MEKIKTLSLDLETYSSVSLKKAGVYPYAESPDFEILLFGYSVNGGPVHVVDIACGEQIPEPVLSALTDDTVIKWAFNASFERICLLLATAPSPGAFQKLQHPGGFRPKLSESRSMALLYGVVRIYGTSSVAGRSRCCIKAGRPEAQRRKRSDPLFLRTLCTDQIQWWPHSQSSSACAG